MGSGFSRGARHRWRWPAAFERVSDLDAAHWLQLDEIAAPYTHAGLVYPNDHRPAHVHVMSRGCEAVVNLNCPAGPVQLRENYEFSRQEIRHIVTVLMDRLVELCRAWEQIHGIA
jgi:hypothetical protein